MKARGRQCSSPAAGTLGKLAAFLAAPRSLVVRYRRGRFANQRHSGLAARRTLMAMCHALAARTALAWVAGVLTYATRLRDQTGPVQQAS